MPSKSKAQARFMAMCAHMEAPPENCPPGKVSREFNKSDAGTGILKGKRKTGSK